MMVLLVLTDNYNCNGGHDIELYEKLSVAVRIAGCKIKILAFVSRLEWCNLVLHTKRSYKWSPKARCFFRIYEISSRFYYRVHWPSASHPITLFLCYCQMYQRVSKYKVDSNRWSNSPLIYRTNLWTLWT